MPSSFDAAQQDILARRRAALEQVANYGSRKSDAAARLAEQRKAAATAQLAGSTQREAPQAVIAQNQATLAQPYDYSTAALERGLASRRASMAQSGAGTDDYLRAASGALPLVQARTAADKAERDAARAHELQMRDYERQVAEMRLRESQEKPLNQLSDAALTNYLLGAADRAEEMAEGHRQTQEATRKAGGWTREGTRSSPVTYFDPILTPAEHAVNAGGGTREGTARAIGERAGVDPNRVRGLIPNAEDKPKKEKDAIKSSGYYKGIEKDVMAYVDQEGVTFDEVYDAIVKKYGKRYPKSVKLVMDELGHLFT